MVKVKLEIPALDMKHELAVIKENKLDSRSFLQGALIGSAVGAAILTAYQYFHTILKQPKLVSKAVFSNLDDFDSEEARAFFITAENIRAGFELRHLKNGEHRYILHAGYRNFRESWARDFGFAAFGLLALEEYDVVRDTLAAFFLYQAQDGRLPVKLQSMGVFSRYLHTLFGREQSTSPILTPKYVTGHGSSSLDGQALLIIAAAQDAIQRSDYEFVTLNWDILRRAVRWLESKTRSVDHPLLFQRAYADWADSVDRHGIGLYTNVLYWKALGLMAQLANKLNFPEDGDNYRVLADKVRTAIQDILWMPNSGYYASTDTLNQFSSAGNLLAVAWGLATQDQGNSILDFLKRNGLADPVPTQVAYPPYPNKLIAVENRIGGLGIYHTDGAWLWIGAWHAIALAKYGRKKEARDVLAAIAGIIVRDQQVHEVYRTDGQPLSNFWYKSEAPLTWSAGMVIYAYKIVGEYFDETTDLKHLAGQLVR